MTFKVTIVAKYISVTAALEQATIKGTLSDDVALVSHGQLRVVGLEATDSIEAALIDSVPPSNWGPMCSSVWERLTRTVYVSFIGNG
jgi:hypothetical protein